VRRPTSERVGGRHDRADGGADSRDPIVPYAHRGATSKVVPGAKLLPIEGEGHEMPPPAIPILIGAILDHTA